jgi:hypothetical protein
MSEIKVTERVFPYHVLNEQQLREQYRIQEERLLLTENDSKKDYDILFDIFLNLKYIKRELNNRK